MRSSVILGTLAHVEYTFNTLLHRSELKNRTPYVLHEAQKIAGEDTVLRPVSPTGWLSRRRQYAVSAGFGYGFGSGVLHDSRPDGLTATVMTKTYTNDWYRPKVAVPYGIKPDNDFRRDTGDVNALWKIIDNVLDLAKKRY